MRDPVMLFRALADETRLQMVALIAKHGELCVCDFEGGLGITQSKASRHLRYLANAGLLQDRREAVWVHYRLRSDLSPAVRGLIVALPELIGPERFAELESKLNVWLEQKRCGAGRASFVDFDAQETHS
ncbi:metalloregulator ArsR/SmtB family transcription factor [bacterium]|nr:metalloregulator ArsR/SmtB family transcription factor [bacterium]MBU1637781.1 metalloregulator ArsR/SmtB family transcription factor [bacterium]